jgi:hypothetical protein
MWPFSKWDAQKIVERERRARVVSRDGHIKTVVEDVRPAISADFAQAAVVLGIPDVLTLRMNVGAATVVRDDMTRAIEALSSRTPEKPS